ncbi:MAG: T9SS type A sorting domain-containing protein [Crocinitomicaceae bacterium]|nr:T9SS type A sorting domain-containing protein [Crocinitomicaceae bacterium]
MKKLLLLFIIAPLYTVAQYNVAYTVTVTRLKALADDCDGGAPFCLTAPQDPVFNIWTTDGEANTNTNCWIYEDDDDAGYGMWIDIQNLEIANETGVNTNFISFDMSGFETDAILAATCNSSAGDDADYPQQFVQQFDLSTITPETIYSGEIDLDGVYFAEIEIWWKDLNAGLFNLDSKVEFTLAPNPSEGQFSVTLSEEEVHGFEVQVMDVTGRVVFANNTNATAMQIDLTGQDAGMYFVNVNADGKTATRRMMLK